MEKLRKLVTGLLALAVVTVSAAPVLSAPASAASAGKEVTIYFQNSQNWKNVYAYLWEGSGNLKGTPAWPGQQMTKVSGTENWYEMKFTPATAFNVIFDDNGQPKPQQTANHTPKDLTSDKTAYWFVPTDSTQTNGNGLTPAGTAVQVYTEAQAGFPTPAAVTSVTDKTTAGTTAAAAGADASKKDAVPKTGDTGVSEPAVAAAALIALAGMGLVLLRKKAAA